MKTLQQLAAACALGLLGMSAIAQNSAPLASKADADDIAFEESIRNFGYVSGAAYQCLERDKRLAHEREVLAAYDGLVRMFGSDRAFYYAAAFGAGSTDGLDRSKCASFLERHRAAMDAGKRGR